MKRATVRYKYRNQVAWFMRKAGFKFHPICKDESKECLTRVNYSFSLSISDTYNSTDKHLKIEINLNP